MEKKLLEEIRDLLQPKENFSLVTSSKTTDWYIDFSRPLFLDPKRKYELALVNLETYNSIPNVSTTNNTFVYSSNNGTAWNTITLPEGSYEVKQINEEIQRQLETNEVNVDKSNPPISVGANTATLRAFVEIFSPTHQVDMTRSTIRGILGFNPQTLGIGYNEGGNPVDIMPVNSILVNCDLINGSFLEGAQQPVIYSFFPDESPGFKVVKEPSKPIYFPISQAGIVSGIRFWLTDQNGKQLNLRGENVTIRIHIRSL